MAANWFPPFVVCSIIATIYFVFMFVNLVPQLQNLKFSNDPDKALIHSTNPHDHKATFSEAVVVTTVFHVFFLMLLVSFIRAILTPPGSIPRTKKWREPFQISSHDERRVRTMITSLSFRFTDVADELFVKSLPVVERKQKNGKYRKCPMCTLYKPDRCHHCRVCETCVLRMDHHCPWIANCVGFHNYKFFLLLLFYAICCTGFIIGAMFPRLLNAFGPMLDWYTFLTTDLPVCLVWALCVAIFSALSAFFFFHMMLVMDAMTTIELKEKKNNDDEFVHHRFYVANRKWHQGNAIDNICHVLGPPWMWLLPIAPEMRDDGTYSFTNYTPNKNLPKKSRA